MTYGGAGNGHLSKNERREAAREKATTIRVQQKKKERVRRFALQGGLIVVTLAIIAVVAVVVTNSAKPAGPGPLNMLSDGIKITTGMKAVSTPALAADAKPVANAVDPESGVIDIQLYVDYFCPFCQTFEQTNNDQIASWIDRGAATVEFHPIAILDANSQGTQYSTRATNAAACVANYSPNSYWDVNKALFAKQPKERTQGLTDDQLVDIVKSAGVTKESSIASCIHDRSFEDWVKSSRLRALDGPIPNAKIDDAAKNKVVGTPMVLVNGLVYGGALDDADAFSQFVIQAAGASFSESSTSTPTPTPTATATPTPTKTTKP